ncbi:hypothetical protein RvY_15878 [Ramazzottius varieornatus]|uniref:Peptidase S1 domain-containing protein n=1 Tax=Ramazzottius varieornatus TaxID=947166 RepID=A0A1D1VZI6_RAMVA|nr:hypothetical protein RvY_15878 [Ramazzottius varieornatus]
MILPIVSVLVLGVVAYGQRSWEDSPELLQKVLGPGNMSECMWITPGDEQILPDGTIQKRGIKRGYGICAENVETCIQIGTVPRSIDEDSRTWNCSVCCVRKNCFSRPKPDTKNQQNGYCMLLKLPQPSFAPSTQFWSPTTTRAPKTDTNTTEWPNPTSEVTRNSRAVAEVFDSEEQACLTSGGQLFQDSDPTWWDLQCPGSGRCCIYPEINKCETCGYKHGKERNWSRAPAGRSGEEDEMLAWKTAVNRMSGTGWNLGMQPVVGPSTADQYSQRPPTYDSLVPPQLWNNFLNRPQSTMRGDSGNPTLDKNQDQEDGWCWQASIVSKVDGSIRCGAALVAEKYLITTASCVTLTSDSFSRYGVRLGNNNIEANNALDLDIAAVFIHPNFNMTTLDNNLGIVELLYAVPCDNSIVCTVCLPSAHLMVPRGEAQMNSSLPERSIRDDINQCVALGWKRRTPGDEIGPLVTLKETNYSPIYQNKSLCESYVRKAKEQPGDYYSFPDRSFCALPQVDHRGKIWPVCREDNGSPLVCFFEGKYFLTGILWTENVCAEHDSGSNIVAKMLQPNRKGKSSPVQQASMFTDVARFIPYIHKTIFDIE